MTSAAPAPEVVDSLLGIIWDAVRLVHTSRDMVHELHSYVFGYAEDKGVVPSSLIVVTNNRSDTCSISHPLGATAVGGHTINIYRQVHEFGRVMRGLLCDLLNRTGEVAKVCVCFYTGPGAKYKDGVIELQTQLHSVIRNRLLNDVGARHRRGPRLDNKEMLWSNKLPAGMSVSFVFNPMLVQSGIELCGQPLSPSSDRLH